MGGEQALRRHLRRWKSVPAAAPILLGDGGHGKTPSWITHQTGFRGAELSGEPSLPAAPGSPSPCGGRRCKVMFVVQKPLLILVSFIG